MALTKPATGFSRQGQRSGEGKGTGWRSETWAMVVIAEAYPRSGEKIITPSSRWLNRTVSVAMTDEQLTTLYPNRFRRENVLASEEQFNIYQNKKIPKPSYFIRYNITDSLYVKDIMPLLAKNGFRLVAKTRVGAIGSGVVYEYVWANFDGQTVN
jgi:hypothetical protein